MKSNVPIPDNEDNRLESLYSYNILDSLPEEEYDSITRLAAQICEVPIALISLVDKDRQWFKSKVGIEVDETTRDISFCQYAIMTSNLFEVEDARQDERFADSPLVIGEPTIVFYAGIPIDDKRGNNLGTLCVIDRHPKKLSEKQIQLMNELSVITKNLILLRYQNLEFKVYKKFFDYSLDMLCVAGTDGYLKRTNPAFTKILGWTEEELKSKPFFEFIHEDDVESTNREVEKLAKGVSTIAFKNRYQKKDGNYVWMDWTSVPDPVSGELFAVAHDITELIETNEKLNMAIHHKEIFLSNMSHEVRTPMNAIKGFTELLQSTSLDEEQRDYLDTIAQASDSLLVVINDILDVSKIDSGTIELDDKPFSIGKVVEQVVKLTSKKAVKKGLKIITSIDQDIPQAVIGDPVRLSQILINLVGNGIKFTPSGNVEIKVIADRLINGSATISFEIKDTGIGIPANKMDKIFERFEQASQDTNREYGGMGLGLNIVKMLIKIHGGDIAVDSVEGRGSTFSFQFTYPIAASLKPTSNILEQQTIPSNLLSGIRILLCEDNELNRKLAENYLNKHNAHLQIAVNGLDALDSLKEEDFDIVIMDLQMPRMDGYQATHEIRNTIKSCVPIIACTAHALPDEKQKCIRAGMNGYLSKPYSEEELINSLFNALPQNCVSGKTKLTGIRLNIHQRLNEIKSQEGPDFLDSILSIYNQRMPGDIEKLRSATKEKDHDLIKEQAHFISGSLSALNFKLGFDISHELERMIKEEQLADVEEQCHELIEYLCKSLKVTKEFNI